MQQSSLSRRAKRPPRPAPSHILQAKALMPLLPAMPKLSWRRRPADAAPHRPRLSAQAALAGGAGVLELAVDLSFGTDPQDREGRSLASQLAYSYNNVRVRAQCSAVYQGRTVA